MDIVIDQGIKKAKKPLSHAKNPMEFDKFSLYPIPIKIKMN